MKLSSKASIFLIISGIISLIVGFIVLTHPGVTLVSLAILLGAGILVAGVLQIISFFADKAALKSPAWTLTLGILDVIIGFILLSQLGATTLALPFIIGFWALFASIARIAAAISFHQLKIKNWGFVLTIGILGLLLAFIILFFPGFGALVITTYVGIYFVFVGFSSIMEAFLIKKMTP